MTDLAATLYAEPAPAPVDPAPAAATADPTPAPPAEAAELDPDPDLDAELAAYRATPERKLYGMADATAALPDDALAAAVGQTVDGVTITSEIAQQSTAILREAISDLGLTRSEMQAIGSATAPIDIPAAHDRAIEYLNADHGQQARMALRAARSYVAANPPVRAFLDRSGLGNDPATVRVIAARALGLVKRGHLTIKGN